MLNLSVARAETYELFSQVTGAPNPQYLKILRGLKPGDSIRFSNGKVCQIGKRLDKPSAGGVTAVFEMADDPTQVLRVARKPAQNFRKYLWLQKDGYPLLAKKGVPTVGLVDSSHAEEYLVVERISKNSISLKEFIRSDKIPLPARRRMTQALEEFAKKTAEFDVIGDFHVGQVVYDPALKKWILLDWAAQHELAFKTLPSGVSVGFTSHTIWDGAFGNSLFADLDNDEQRLRARTLYDRLNKGVRKAREGIDCAAKYKKL